MKDIENHMVLSNTDSYDMDELEEVSDSELEEMYEDMLDECYEPVQICELEYSPSLALYRVDPTAYACGFNDYLDSLLNDDSIFEINGKYYRQK